MVLAGLPKEMNTNHSNIHLLTTSNRVNALDLIKPIVHELKQLEYGVFIYDSYWKQDIFVIAPLFAVLCDNPRASELCGHMTGNPKRFCRLCLVSYYNCIVVLFYYCFTLV